MNFNIVTVSNINKAVGTALPISLINLGYAAVYCRLIT